MSLKRRIPVQITQLLCKVLMLAVACIALVGCATAISRSSMRLVDRTVAFSDLRNDPERYNGHFILVGGAIVSVRNKSNGDEMELVQLKTNEDGEIIDTTQSEGRLFAISPSFLDPAIYQPGRLVTLVGEVRGTKKMPLGETEYVYPVLIVREIHLWKAEDLPERPRFHFGIGIGTIIH